MLKCNCKLQSYRKTIWNKCIAQHRRTTWNKCRAPCLFVKLVTCVQSLCYLQWVSFILFSREKNLASCSENTSLLCNFLWWVVAGISCAFPSACVHLPLQWFSNGDICCAVPIIYTLVNTLESIRYYSQLFDILWLYLHLICVSG